MRNLMMLKIIWMLLAIFACIASLIGLLTPDVYSSVASQEIMPGIWSQDLLSLILAIALLIMTLLVKEYQFKKLAIILGIVGYLFYGYGIYVIEQLYTPCYLLYMAIFGLAFYSFMGTLFSLEKRRLESMRMRRWVKRLSIGFFLLVPALFSTLWISQILGQIRLSQKLEFTHGVYILDLAFIMPLFVIVAVLLIRDSGWGFMLAPVLYVKGFTVLFPVGLGGLINPMVAASESMFYLVFALAFLVLLGIYMQSWQIKA